MKLEQITLANTAVIGHSSLLAITEKLEPSILITILAIVNTALQVWLSYRKDKKNVQRNQDNNG